MKIENLKQAKIEQNNNNNHKFIKLKQYNNLNNFNFKKNDNNSLIIKNENNKESKNNYQEPFSSEKRINFSNDEQKLNSPKNYYSINNIKENNNIIESKKDSKIYSSKKYDKKIYVRTQSAINNKFPNLNNNINYINKKQQTIRPSSSTDNLISDNQRIIIEFSDNILKSKTINQNQQNHLFEEDNKNKKNKNNINSKIYFVPSFGHFKSTKIRSNLSPNVHALLHGVEQLFDNNNLGRHNQSNHLYKNYTNIENIKKSPLNNTELNFYKKRSIYERNNDAKEIQGIINNLQGYIKGYDSNFMSPKELKEERKKIYKNSSYYKFKEMANENRKNNLDIRLNNIKRNIVEIGFNEYK